MSGTMRIFSDAGPSKPGMESIGLRAEIHRKLGINKRSEMYIKAIREKWVNAEMVGK